MRKFKLLLASVLCIVGIGTAKADVITAASQLSNTKVYTIRTTRGYMTLNTDQTMIVSTHKVMEVQLMMPQQQMTNLSSSVS